MSRQTCEPGEFQCNFAADGCIPDKKVYDGEVDCLRDGYDESPKVRQQVAGLLFPNGKRHDSCRRFTVERACLNVIFFR